jgi:hypothetical protein
MKPRPSGAQLATARELLGWSTSTVAGKIGRAVKSVQMQERQLGSLVTADRLVALYEAHGVEFLPDGQVRIKTAGAK